MKLFLNLTAAIAIATLATGTAPTFAQNARLKAAAVPSASTLDVFAFENGAQFVQIPSESNLTDMNESPINLIDGALNTEWSVGASDPAVLVLELAERTELTRIAFDSKFLGHAENAPRAIVVEVSDTSAITGFVPVLSTNLRIAADNQSFSFQPNKLPIGRWVRLTINSNYGMEYTRFTGFRGYGRQLTNNATMPNVSGSFEGASGIGPMSFSQAGNQVTGCYEYQKGNFTGTIAGRVLKLDSLETSDDGSTKRLRGLFSLSPDGRKFVGIMRAPGPVVDAGYATFVSAQRTSTRPGRC
jgi:hypothetical protein